MPTNLSHSRCHGNNPAELCKLNNCRYLKNNDGTLFLYMGTGSPKTSFFSSQSTPTFHVIFMTIIFVIIFPVSLTTALPTPLPRSYTGDNLAAGLILKKYSTPMTVKVASLGPKTYNISTQISNGSEYATMSNVSPTSSGNDIVILPNGVPDEASKNDININDDHSSIPVSAVDNTSQSTAATPGAAEVKHVNLAVIPVLGIFFLMILVCFKGCSWFREHLKEHDVEDDGKDYVILSAPEDGYREVEFRSDTSSMYYDTVSSFRSILRQKGEFGSYGGYNNYDTVTSIRSYLQRADVRDAAVQVRLHGQRPDRWKSVSGILNNGGGSNSDLLRVPKKTHRQVSFQTSHNEAYDPPSPRMCDSNIQVGDSTMKQLTSRFQNGIARQISSNQGSRSCLTSSNPNRHSSASLRSMDKPENQPLKRTDSSGSASASNSVGTNVGSGVPARPQNRRFHNFQVLRVNSTDRLGAREIERIDTSPLRQAMMTSHYIEQNRSSSGLALHKTGLPLEHQDRLDRGELYGAPMTTMCHPHYLCDQFVQTDSDSANDAMSPVTAAAHTSISPPVLTEVKFGQAQSEDEDSDELDRRKKSETRGLLELYIGESSDTTTGEESMMTSGRNSASWSEQMDEEDQLQKLLQAHASAIAGAPIASPISLNSTSSSSTDDIAQIVELDCHQNAAEVCDATTASDESGEGRSGIDRHPGRSQADIVDKPIEQETPPIERSVTDVGSSPYSQSPDIRSGILISSRPHRVSSGYDTQGPESSSVKGPAEAGDSSCDVTPLTSSSNSLQECGREAGKHSQTPLQLLIFQQVPLEERVQTLKATDFENQPQAPPTYPLRGTVTGKDGTLTAQNLDQPLSYIPQLHPNDTNNNNDIPDIDPNDNTFPRHSLGSTDSNYSNQSSNVSIENVPLIPAGSTPTDCLHVDPTTITSCTAATKNDNSQDTGIDTTLDESNNEGTGNPKTPTSTAKDSFKIPADNSKRLRTKTETLPPVVIPLNSLPPPPPSAKGASSYQARKRANTSTDSNVKR